MIVGLLLAGIAVGLALGCARGLLSWGTEGMETPKRPMAALLVQVSIPFLFLGSVLVFLWPGSLAPAVLGGSLQVLAGLALLGFSYLFLERTPLVEGGLYLDRDPWTLPRDLRPLGATWGLREEILAALILAPLLALRSQGLGAEAGLVLLAGAWLGLALPGAGLAWAGARLRRSAQLRSDAGCCLLRPSFFRMATGLSGLALVVAAAETLFRGVRLLALSWSG